MYDHKKCITNAIESCLINSKAYKDSKDIISRLRTQDSMLHSKLRYSIARDVARFLLNRYGNLIRSLNLYGSTMEYTAGIYSDIDIILHVASVNKEIIDDLDQINSLLTLEYYNLLNEICDEFCYLMDIHIVNDDPVETKNPSKAYLEHILHNDSVPLS